MGAPTLREALATLAANWYRPDEHEQLVRAAADANLLWGYLGHLDLDSPDRHVAAQSLEAARALEPDDAEDLGKEIADAVRACFRAQRAEQSEDPDPEIAW